MSCTRSRLFRYLPPSRRKRRKPLSRKPPPPVESPRHCSGECPLPQYQGPAGETPAPYTTDKVSPCNSRRDGVKKVAWGYAAASAAQCPGLPPTPCRRAAIHSHHQENARPSLSRCSLFQAQTTLLASSPSPRSAIGFLLNDLKSVV